MILIKNIEVYNPENIGKQDVLVVNDKILLIDQKISFELKSINSKKELTIIDGAGKYLLPGFIDNHVHLIGGGGEGGFTTRTPEVDLETLVKAGVTTVVGCLGTDGYTRSLADLLAKVMSLNESGITAYMYSGSYQIPQKTLTDSIVKDMLYVEKVIGSGEIAVSDHRSSQTTYQQLIEMVASTRLGGILTGKAGVVNFHLGEGKRGLEPLRWILENSEIPASQLLPTHVNRNPMLFKEAVEYALAGGYVDITTSTCQQFLDDGEVEHYQAVKELLEAGVNSDNITLSSDGQGSLPDFDENGKLKGMTIGTSNSLYRAVVKGVKKGNLKLDTILKTITKNPAKILKLKNKGEIKEGFDADLVLVEKESLDIRQVIAKGKILV